MTTAHLKDAIATLKQKATIKKDDGDIYYRGEFGTAKLFKHNNVYNVYFFEPGQLRSYDLHSGFKTKREAEFFALQSAVTGFV